MIFEVIALDKTARKFRQKIAIKSRRLAKVLPKKGGIEIYLVDDKRMRRLNKQFRGKDKATNVLSFVKPKGFPGPELGEVYLDPVYILKNKENLDLMLAHGVLHILGYDHKQKRDRIIMQKKERELLKKLAVKK